MRCIAALGPLTLAQLAAGIASPMSRCWPGLLEKWLLADDPEPADHYTEFALRRIWRATHFSWWMTSMLHHTGDLFDAQL